MTANRLPLLHRLRHRNPDDGFSLTEMVVILALVSIVGTIALTIIMSVFRTQRTVMSRSDAQQQMQLAVDQVASEIRNADGVYDPTTDPDGLDGWELVSYATEGTLTTTCTQWQYLNADGSLRSRSWPTSWPTTGGVTPWRTVATGLTNSASPFTVEGNSNYRDNVKVVKLDLESDTGNGAVITIKSAATGRNTTKAFVDTTCSDRPAP